MIYTIPWCICHLNYYKPTWDDELELYIKRWKEQRCFWFYPLWAFCYLKQVLDLSPASVENFSFIQCGESAFSVVSQHSMWLVSIQCGDSAFNVVSQYAMCDDSVFNVMSQHTMWWVSIQCGDSAFNVVAQHSMWWLRIQGTTVESSPSCAQSCLNIEHYIHDRSHIF